MAAYVTLLVAGDYLFTFVPGIQIVMLLMFVLAKSFKPLEAFLILTVYVILDNLLYGGISIYTIPMLIGWLAIVLPLNLFRSKELKGSMMALLSIPAAFIYSLPFMIFTVFLYQVDPITYLIADFPFTIAISLSSYLTINLLYDRIVSVMKSIT